MKLVSCTNFLRSSLEEVHHATSDLDLARSNLPICRSSDEDADEVQAPDDEGKKVHDAYAEDGEEEEEE
jgi:hypothetical protein